MVYTTLRAGFNLDGSGCPNTISPTFANITRAYPPDYLMTLPRDCNYHQAGKAWAKLRIQDLMNPPQNWISAQGCFWELGHGALGGLRLNGTDMAASPYLSFPPDILTFAPEWKGCRADAYEWAFDDPPSALTPASVLVTTSSTSSDIIPSSTSQTTSTIQQHNLDPSPGEVATLVPVIETRTPSSISAPTFAPDPMVLADPTFTSNRQPLPNPASVANPPTLSVPKLHSSVLLPSKPIPLPDKPSSLDPSFLSTNSPNLHNHESAPQVEPAKGQATIESTRIETLSNKNPSTVPTRVFFPVAAEEPQQTHTTPNGDGSVQETNVQQGGPAVTKDGAPTFAVSRPLDHWESADDIHSSLRHPSLPLSTTNGQRAQAVSASHIIVGGKSIEDGQQVTIGGHVVSNGQGRAIIDGTALKTLQHSILTATATSNPLPSIIGKKPLGLDRDGALVLDGKTMLSGMHTTVDGKYVFVEASQLVIDSTTYSLPQSLQSTGAESAGQSSPFDGTVPLDIFTMDPSRPMGDQAKHKSLGQGSAITSTDAYRAVTSGAIPITSGGAQGAPTSASNGAAAASRQTASPFSEQPLKDTNNSAQTIAEEPDSANDSPAPGASSGSLGGLESTPSGTVDNLRASLIEFASVPPGETFRRAGSSQINTGDQRLVTSSSTSTSAVPGGESGAANIGPGNTANAQNNPADAGSMGAMIMSAFGNMAPQPAEPSPAAEPGGPPSLSTGSNYTMWSSDGFSNVGRRSHLLCPVALILGLLPQLL